MTMTPDPLAFDPPDHDPEVYALTGWTDYYHRTNAAAADSILRHGFRDATGSYGLVGHTLTGVFISDVPLDWQEGAQGDFLLRIRVPDGQFNLDYFELVEEAKTYREWCVPASLLNDLGIVAPVDDDDLSPEMS